MKALKLVIWVILIVASISVVVGVAVHIRHSMLPEANMPDTKGKVVLGPMPPESYMPDPLAR